ncbi:MAG: methyltransferase domain-containing protein [Alphaproteobacteria bacterium]|nr:methyltransferase domain-containing protein [Alphaproteobacteria bacterium]
MEINYVCSLGPYCQSSQVLKRWNLKKCSYPFDWIFSNCDIILHCIKDDFKVFLDREYYKTITHDRCEHTYYKLGCMFNHSNPKIDDDKYSYYGRCVNRFRSLLAYDGHKLFMMMMLNMVEPDEKNITQITEFNNKFFNKNLNLPRELIIKLIGAIDKLPEKYSILEIGSNIGFVGEEIEKRMQEGFSITGIESSAEMIKLQKQSKRDKIYDKIINLPVENYLIDHKDEKYDIILSLDGFSNNSELSDLFGQLYNSLSSGGYFAFACRLSDKKDFSDKYLEFVYEEHYITKLLKKCGFTIIDEPNSEPLIKNSYVIFVGKKLN